MDIQTLEKKLWQTANKLRNNMDAAEYKHVVLGLIFLKYVSDSFEQQYKKAELEGFDPEDRDFYIAENVFWIPKESRWHILSDNAKQPTIGVLIDSAMESIEKDNPSLRGVLPKNYAREALDKRRLGELIDTFTNTNLHADGHDSKDLLGRIYEYFMGMFAEAEGKKGGQFYTPRSVVRLLVEMIEPYRGRIYDPCCGSGGMFVQSEKFLEEHSGKIGDIAVYGQESNQTTWKLAKMNMAIRGIDADIKFGDTLHNDKLQDLRADFILANPPFNDSDWGGERLNNDIRWKFNTPPSGNANFAWIQHFIHHLSPQGVAGFVLADSSLSAVGAEATIRKNIINEGIVDCIVSLPGQLFTNTGIPACLWFIRRNKSNSSETLFINAQTLGSSLGRRKREFDNESISKITSAYHAWRAGSKDYIDEIGFCRSVSAEVIADNDYVLAPSRYISSEEGSLTTHKDIESPEDYSNFKKLARATTEKIDAIQDGWSKTPAVIKIQDVIDTQNNAKSLNEFSRHIYEDLIVKYFDSMQKLTELPAGWDRKRFGELFEESKLKVKDYGSCPEVFSVTNMGIQSRSEKYSKELSKVVDGYKVAFRGDIVFGLSREIPNLDVLLEETGAFSPAYNIYRPKDIRIGLIVGTIMRLRLMEQADLLKGGAREGRGLDKDKLSNKTYVLPEERILNELWGSAK